jgi:rhamnogalacturonan endolyase
MADFHPFVFDPMGDGMPVLRNRRGRSLGRRSIGLARCERLEERTLFAFGLTTTSSSYAADTGAGLVFSVARSNGDLTSTKLNGTELEASHSATGRYSHYESGLSSGAAVTATIDPNGNWIEIACDDTGSGGVGVIQYYLARKGYNNLYMATYSPGPNSPSPGEMRFIMYTNHSILTNAPAPSNNTGATGAIESQDVFGHPDGTTTSKYYGEYRAIDAQTYGLTGGGFGVFMNIGNRETSSGGPFFKDIDFQTTSAQSTELYTYVFSGHSQTENFRPGLKGPYALEFTTGTNPGAPDYSWIDSWGLGSYLTGYIPASGRGALTGTASSVASGLPVTVGLSNATAQYWGTPDASGNYMISGILPGTYAETLYQGELAVGTKTVTVAADATTNANIVNTFYIPANPIFRIGTWDGTPLGFLNADKITTMHPTDARMNPWAADSTGFTNFTVGTDSDSAWPMAEWHTQTGSTQNGVTTYEDVQNRITFNLTSAQVQNLTLRIGLTRLDQGRPTISVNSGAWNSAIPSIASEPNSRGLTTGNWRGNNALYTFNIPSSALHAGSNTIDIYCTSGSTGTIYSGYQIYDAIDLVPTSSASTPKISSVTVTPANPTIGLNGTKTFTAVARDANGNVIPANIDWSAASGTIDANGNYVAPATGGTDTITASATETQTPGYSTTGSSSTSFGSSVSAIGSTSVTVQAVAPPALVGAPVINGDNPNGLYTAAGQPNPGVQRSMVEDIVYTFNEPVTIPDANAAFTVKVAGSTGTVPSTLIATAVPGSNGTQWAVSLTGQADGVLASIANGEYSISINPNAVFAAADGTTAMASGRTDTFFRLFGDINGDRVVNVSDEFQFSRALSTYNPIFDANGDGTVNLADEFQASKSFSSGGFVGDGFVTTI